MKANSFRRVLFLICSAAMLAGLPFAAAAQMSIVAVVNDDIISSLDVEQRYIYALATTNMRDSTETRQQLYPQLLRQLVDERLQIQEAARLGHSVTENEIADAFANVNQQRGLPPGSFQQFLASQGVPIDTAKEQMRAQTAWTKVVMHSLRNRVRVSEDEVQREREKAGQGQNITEYRISSIVLAVENPEEEQQLRALAERLSGEIREGANFNALARQFSAGGSEVIEENQGRWVAPHQLEPVLARALSGITPGNITPPVRTLTGYHLIKLHDMRSVNTAQVLDSEVLLKQISMKLAPDAQHRDAEMLLEIAREVGRHPGVCLQDTVAGASGLEDLEFDVSFQRVEFRQIQPQLQAMLANLRVGDVSQPYATPDGIHLVQLCERVDMPRQLPPAEQVRDKIFRDKVELEAAKRLRDLRRDALIDIRN